MKALNLLLSILVIFICSSSNAGQHVAGLEIDYPLPFKPDNAAAQKLLSNIPYNVRQLVESLKMFHAEVSNGLGDVSLVKIRYESILNGSIDGAANESAQRISGLEGIKNFKKHIKPLSVSGLPARRVSISADRWGGKVGAETLIVYNRRTNDMWQMQLIFAKKKGINPFASINLDEERNYAKNLLSTIKVTESWEDMNSEDGPHSFNDPSILPPELR